MGTAGPKLTSDSSTQVPESIDATAPNIEESHPLVQAGEQVTDTAGHLASRATDIGIQQADRGRELAADGIYQVAQGIRRLSTELETGQPAIAGAAETAAEQAERLADYLRNNDARQMLSKVEDAARQQPLLFLGGAFVLGVAASRFLKAASTPSGAKSLTDGQRSYRFANERPAAYQATGPGSTVGAERL
jgi:hypothetical protein